MDAKIRRIITFIKEEKVRDFFSFVFYVLSIGISIDLPSIIKNSFYIVNLLILLFVFYIYYEEWVYKVIANNIENLGKNIIKEIKKIAKEIMIFIPIELICLFITSFIMVGQSANQIRINERFYQAPIFNAICIIIIEPIMEEVMFRFLPYRFIKNKRLYIVASSIIFASMHVIGDEKAFYYIWFYMIRSFYYGYRYHKTKDLLVPIFMHSFNNLIVTVLFLYSLEYKFF